MKFLIFGAGAIGSVFGGMLGTAGHQVLLVGRMLDLHEKLAAATIPDDRALYRRQIEATDRQIDALVYELYDLTEDEIAVVEKATT